MRIGNFEHNPGMLIVALFLLFLAALLSLGSWQMHRAAEKKVILAVADKAAQSAPVDVSQITDAESSAIQHTRVVFTGKYLGDTQFLWDNRVHKGQAGFEVIAPVQTAQGVVLVNRGWVAPGRTRADLPDVSISPEFEQQAIEFSGLFSRPSKGLINGDAFDSTTSWPRVVQYFDYEAMSGALNVSLLAGVVQLQIAGGEASAVRDDLLVPNWQPTASMGPARHYSYAFQWFAMAVALTILYLVYNTKRIERNS